jgi:malonyl-CoA O-methyltransferase
MNGVPAPAERGSRLFRDRVRRSFGRRAAEYDRHALLQRAVAWRLARSCRAISPPPGPAADLGAGSGLLSRDLLHHCAGLRSGPPLQVDLCPELLSRNPLLGRDGSPAAAEGLRWDLNRGLPASLRQASLLVSSFALQWLEDPAVQLHHWCRSLRCGGWLAVAVPTAGSLPQWRRAAWLADVPCTALDLPEADGLIAAVAAAEMLLCRVQRLRFTRIRQGGRTALRQLQRLGAGASRRPPLSPSQLRRLLAHWPPETPLTWEILVLIGRKL